MTEKRFIPIFDGIDKRVVGAKDTGRIISFMDMFDLLNALHEENEQLKNENYELHKRLGDFEPFERYMKERTSKTSVNDIIGLVKTNEPTNSVELKKELYK